MDYLLYLTERCNLACRYCESAGHRALHARDVDAHLDDVIAFLRRDPDVRLQLYGGEPLLRIDLLARVLDQVPCRQVLLQTNGLLLDRLDAALLDRVDVICLSVDGPPAVTDAMRGPGVHRRALAQARALRRRGFSGRIDARMTVSPGGDVYRAVTYLARRAGFAFDQIYWQLNVLFHASGWRRQAPAIGRWFEERYNPGVRRLVDFWVRELLRGRRHQIVPFAALAHALLTGARVERVRCGAGHRMWTIDPDGEIYPCPLMRRGARYARGDVRSISPAQLGPPFALAEPCPSCDVRGLCGGRCLCANHEPAWGAAGFALVCDSVRALLAALREVAPQLEALVAEGQLRLEDLDVGQDYEVIP